MNTEISVDANQAPHESHRTSTRIIRIHPQYLFPLIGFGFGTVVSFVTMALEEVSGHIPAGSTQLDHFIHPVLFGTLGAMVGYFFGKRRQQYDDYVLGLFRRQQTLNLVLDNLPILISYLDSDLHYRYVNKLHEEWLGMDTAEILGKGIGEIVDSETLKIIRENLDRARRGEILQFESTRQFRGKTRILHSTLIPHRNEANKLEGFFTIVADFTRLRKREEKVRKQHEELKEINATKDKFFSIIAHDLKNPFNALLGLTEVLNDDYDTLDENTRKKFIRLIFEDAEKTARLLENLLVWSRSQRGKIGFEPVEVNLDEIIHESTSLLNHSASQKRITVETESSGNPVVLTDKNLINTVVRNLLSNAIKFTPEEGKIRISVSKPGPEKSSRLELRIQDSGVGISPENLRKLFRVDKSFSMKGTNGESGTGLGLIICKEFVEKCGGKIRVESQPGEGSCFIVELPQRPEQVSGQEQSGE